MGMYNDSIKVTLDGTVQRVTTTSQQVADLQFINPTADWILVKILKDGDSAPGAMATSTASSYTFPIAPGANFFFSRDSAGIQNTYDPSKIYVKRITSNPVDSTVPTDFQTMLIVAW